MQTDASIRLYGYLDMIKLNKGKRDESVKIFLIENKYVNWKKREWLFLATNVCV